MKEKTFDPVVIRIYVFPSAYAEGLGMKVVCPRCGRPGYLTVKRKRVCVLKAQLVEPEGGVKPVQLYKCYAYWYVKHREPSKWCYLGRELPDTLKTVK